MVPVQNRLHALKAAGQDQGKLYALIDAALAPELRAAVLEQHPVPVCSPLLLGDEAATLAGIAPTLIELTEEHQDFLLWLLDEGYGENGGIFLCSSAEFGALYHHLFCLTAVRDPEGEKIQFRFHDPRIFKPFWRVLDEDERHLLLGPITRLLIEEPDQSGWRGYHRKAPREIPPYPPAPEDWTTLPEPWWQLTEEQYQAIKGSLLDRFLRGFTDHLGNVRDVIRPDYKKDFHSLETVQELKKQADYLMRHGFESMAALSTGLEHLQIYRLDLEDTSIRHLVESTQYDVDRKLEGLRRLSEKRFSS